MVRRAARLQRNVARRQDPNDNKDNKDKAVHPDKEENCSASTEGRPNKGNNPPNPPLRNEDADGDGLPHGPEDPLFYLANALMTIGLNQAQIVSVFEQLGEAKTLTRFTKEDLIDLFKRPRLRGLPSNIRHHMEGLQLHMINRKHHCQIYDLSDFRIQDIYNILDRQALEEAEANHPARIVQNASVQAPPQFNGNQAHWSTWRTAMEAFLAATPNAVGIPLSYVIRNATFDHTLEPNSIEYCMQNTPLHGPQYKSDNCVVWFHIQSHANAGSVQALLHQFESNHDGRAAWYTLLARYAGTSERITTIQQAQQQICNAHYEKESRMFTFDHYASIHLNAVQELQDYGQPVPVEQQICDFALGISNSQVQTYCAIAMSLTDWNVTHNFLGFIAAVKNMAVLNNAFSTTTGQNCARTVSAMQTNNDNQSVATQNTQSSKCSKSLRKSKGGCGNQGQGNQGRGRGQGQRGNQSVGYYGNRNDNRDIPYYVEPSLPLNGTPQSNTTPTNEFVLHPDLYMQMTPFQREMFRRGWEFYNNKNANRPNYDRQFRENENRFRQQSATTAARTVGENSSLESKRRPPPPADQFGATGANNRRLQGSIQTHARRIAKNIAVIPPVTSDYKFRGQAELDSRADTVCAGAAFALLELTNRVCDVSGFHGELGAMPNVPIATTATAFDHPTLNETLILVTPESLYFGLTLPESLLSIPQLQDNGVQIYSCPKQYSRDPDSHCLHLPEVDICLPLALHGCISYLPTRLPTEYELNNCQRIYLTSEKEWVPYSDEFEKQKQRLKIVSLTSK